MGADREGPDLHQPGVRQLEESEECARVTIEFLEERGLA